MSLSSIIIQQIVSVLQNTTFTSANPKKINKVKDVNTAGIDIGFDQDIQDAIAEAVDKITSNIPIETKEPKISLHPKSKKDITEGKEVSMARQTLGLTQDPERVIEFTLKTLPHAVLLAFAVSLAPLIFNEMTKPGGPLDLRFRRLVSEEINAFLSRQTQKDTEFGYRQVIIQSKLGFTASNGVNNYNTVRGIREGGLNKERDERFGIIQQTKGGLNRG